MTDSPIEPRPADAVPVRPPPPELLSPGVLVPAFVLMIVLGYFVFTRGWCTKAGNELSPHQSLLTAVNAATLTGFQQARNPSDYTSLGRVVTLGLMVGGTLFSLIGGGLAVTRIARLPYRDRTVALAAVVAVVAVAIIGAVALRRPPTRTPAQGVYQAISAFGNCGLFTGPLPVGDDLRATFVLLPLAILGGLGLPVLLDLGRGRPSGHTGRVLITTAVVYLLTTGALFPLLGGFGSSAAMTASREAINARSAGFPFNPALPSAAAVVLLASMVIGGAAGGTAGGVKVTTLAVLAAGLRDTVRGRSTNRAFGVAVAWIAIYLGLLLAAWVALLATEPADARADGMLFLAVSALGNVGLSRDPVVPSTAGMYVLSATMLLGRVLPVIVLWTVADRAPVVTDAIG